MKRGESEIDLLLAKLKPPDPPLELRDRVMQSAREAFVRARPPDVWTRACESRPLRVAWGLSVALLVIGHVAVSAWPSARFPRAASRRVPVEAGRDRELAAIGELPRNDERARPILTGMTKEPEEQPESPDSTRAHPRKESAS